MVKKKRGLERDKMEKSRSKELCDKIMLRILNNRALAAGWIDERTKLRIDRKIGEVVQ